KFIIMNELMLQAASSLAVGMTILFMLIMSVILMYNYRNKSIYILLITGLSFVLIQQLFSCISIEPASNIAFTIAITSTLLQFFFFVLFNFVFIRLYAYQAALRIFPFIVLSCVTVLLAGISLFFDPYVVEQANSLHYSFPMLDFYMILLIVIMLIATRQANMTGKYYSSLIVMFAYELAYVLDAYLFNESQIWITFCLGLLPIIYYILLFTLLFEWVIERLLSTYQSSIMDGLTGLYVRSYFNKKINSMLSRSKIAI